MKPKSHGLTFKDRLKLSPVNLCDVASIIPLRVLSAPAKMNYFGSLSSACDSCLWTSFMLGTPSGMLPSCPDPDFQASSNPTSSMKLSLVILVHIILNCNYHYLGNSYKILMSKHHPEILIQSIGRI